MDEEKQYSPSPESAQFQEHQHGNESNLTRICFIIRLNLVHTFLVFVNVLYWNHLLGPVFTSTVSVIHG